MLAYFRKNVMSYLAIQSVGRKIIGAFTSFELLEERLAAFKGLEEKKISQAWIEKCRWKTRFQAWVDRLRGGI